MIVTVKAYGHSTEVEVCCRPFAAALEPGTDNECYGALICDVWLDPPQEWIAGVGLPVIRFCPWCGKELPRRAGVEPGDR